MQFINQSKFLVKEVNWVYLTANIIVLLHQTLRFTQFFNTQKVVLKNAQECARRLFHPHPLRPPLLPGAREAVPLLLSHTRKVLSSGRQMEPKSKCWQKTPVCSEHRPKSRRLSWSTHLCLFLLFQLLSMLIYIYMYEEACYILGKMLIYMKKTVIYWTKYVFLLNKNSRFLSDMLMHSHTLLPNNVSSKHQELE